VDDDEFIRDVTTEILMLKGYKVILAKNGVEALQLYQLNMAQINTVILDLNMPRMNGEETFRELKKMNSNVNVIISSGYCEEELDGIFLCMGAVAFIHKPYNFSVLTQTLKLITSSNRDV
jgi:DNA-binding response OmpR family regulator